MVRRTLDIGGDKSLPYFQTPHEHNPQLGWRGLRITLEWQDLLRVQLRAALRASALGPIRILLPMVSSIEEIRAVREVFMGVRSQLSEQGYQVALMIRTTFRNMIMRSYLLCSRAELSGLWADWTLRS